MDSKLRQIADVLFACPSADAFSPRLLSAQTLPNLFMLDVERDGGLSLRVRLIGTGLEQFFGRPLRGQTLESFLHGPRARDVIAGFHDTARSGKPVWMREVVRFKDRAPRFVEGVVFRLSPDRLYGGLVAGEVSYDGYEEATFERADVAPPA